MNKWFAKIRKQENGSIAIFVAGLISIMMILFILVLNLGSVYAVKEKSATTAQQASLAATSAFYERVQEIVFSFDPFSYLPEEVEDTTILEPFFSLNFKIQERANSFRTMPSYAGWSDNELWLEAFDDYVINDLFPVPFVGPALKQMLRLAPLENVAAGKAREAVLQNGGTLEGARLIIEDSRIKVRAANKINSISFGDDLIDSITDNLYQQGGGPKIELLNHIWNGSANISL